MASRLVQEKRAPVVMIELLEKVRRSLRTASSRPPLLVKQQAQGTVRREIRQAHWIEPVVLRLAAETQPATPTMPRELLARPE
jgi:hypothetical protein